MVTAHLPELTSSSFLGFCQSYWAWLPAKKDEEMTATKSCYRSTHVPWNSQKRAGNGGGMGGIMRFIYPIGSMYGIFIYIWLMFMVNVGTVSIPYMDPMGMLLISKMFITSPFPHQMDIYSSKFQGYINLVKWARDLTRPKYPQIVVWYGKSPKIPGKSGSVKYYNLARSIEILQFPRHKQALYPYKLFGVLSYLGECRWELIAVEIQKQTKTNSLPLQKWMVGKLLAFWECVLHVFPKKWGNVSFMFLYCSNT